MKIVILGVEHDHQRYNTLGDWVWPFEDQGYIAVSRMTDWRHEALIGIHEMVEMVLCRHAGISEQKVLAFDIGIGKDLDDPGSSPMAPYHRQHMLAETIERLLAIEMGVDWPDYELACDEVVAGYKTETRYVEERAGRQGSEDGGQSAQGADAEATEWR